MSDVKKKIEHWVSKEVRAVNAYHVPPAEGLIKMDAMENPYRLPRSLQQQWLEVLSTIEINRYPDPACIDLKQRIRKVFGVGDQYGLIIGNGSDELIQMLATLVGGVDRAFVSPTPSFAMYRLICIANATKFVGVPLDENFELDTDQFLQTIEQHQPACVFLAYPNNPTGNCFDPESIEKIIAKSSGLVIVDEAYSPFSGKTLLKKLDDYPNLMIMRTLSKSGMAGLRLGMLIGNPEWIEQLEKIRLPYNTPSLSQVSATFGLDHQEILQQQIDQIVKDRNWLWQELNNRPGVTPYPSETNFILAHFEQDANTIHQNLLKQNILVKNLSKEPAPLNNCLRITVGTSEENTKFLSALDYCLASTATT